MTQPTARNTHDADIHAARGQVRYITTPIYYASGQAHAGHLYTTLMAQILKEHHLGAGRKVMTLTGMDEHGEKIAEKAKKAGLSPQSFVDQLKDEWSARWAEFGLDFDIFLRTSSAEHKKTVQDIFRHCHAKGDIYFGEHEGRYCIECEEFLTEAQLDGEQRCLIHKRVTEVRREGNYFFRTTRYREELRELVQSGALTSSRRYTAELLGMLNHLETDLSVSRPKTRTQWGIELPFDADHVAYVWFDALPNYITGIGGLEAARTSPYWSHALHILGKDILRFHGIYWPAILLSLGLPVPRLLVHGWLLQAGEKMSKSLGNVMALESIRDKIGKDAFVNAVFRAVNPGDDFEISEAQVTERYNADLANGTGNLLSRTMTLALRAFGGAYPACSHDACGAGGHELEQAATHAVGLTFAALEEARFADALRAIEHLVATTDGYLTRCKPWELIKGPLTSAQPQYAEAARVLAAACGALRIIGLLSFPFFPEKMRELLRCLGEDVSQRHDFYARALTFWPQDASLRRLSEPPRLFPRKDPVPQVDGAQQLPPLAAKATPRPPKKEGHTARPSAEGTGGGAEAVDKTKTGAAKVSHGGGQNIAFEHFAQVDLRVGLVEKAELVEGSDRLIRVEVQLGALGVRQIFSGIREWVRPEDLAGRKVLIVANLEPRKMRFGVSEGMLLSTEDADGRVTPVLVSDDIEPGSKLA